METLDLKYNLKNGNYVELAVDYDLGCEKINDEIIVFADKHNFKISFNNLKPEKQAYIIDQLYEDSDQIEPCLEVFWNGKKKIKNY